MYSLSSVTLPGFPRLRIHSKSLRRVEDLLSKLLAQREGAGLRKRKGEGSSRGNRKGYVDCEGDQREKADMLLSKLGGP